MRNVRMIGRALFYWHLRRKHYTEALAALKEICTGDSAEIWACYRLGLFNKVSKVSSYRHDWRTYQARIVSLAACGHIEEATDMARTFTSSLHDDRQLRILAKDLLSYSPALALEILQTVRRPLLLDAPLYLYMGERDKTLLVLDQIDKSGIDDSPERHLYKSNAEVYGSKEKITLMNIFLQTFKLPPLSLKEYTSVPSINNLICTERFQATSGPLVTILMTAYQSEAYIKSAIESLLIQTYHNIELIVIDDASSDATQKIVQDLALQDSRIVYMRLSHNVGTFAAKNIGLEKSSGEFVTCHDSDDWAHPLKIEQQVAPLLQNKKLVFTTSYWVRLQDDGVYYARQIYPLMRLNPASPLFRKALVLSKAGGWDTVRTGADSEFLARLKLVFGQKAMYRIKKPLTFGAHRPDSLMTADATGYNVNGVSPVRLEYWEAWTLWHISELREGRRPKIPLDLLAERPFSAPASIKVSRQSITANLDHINRAHI